MRGLFSPTLKKAQRLLDYCMAGDKSSYKKLAKHLLHKDWTNIIDQALAMLPNGELNLLKTRFHDRKHPDVLDKLERLCLERNPQPTQPKQSAVELEAIRLEQLAQELEEKASQLRSFNYKTRQVGLKTIDLSSTQIELDYMDRVEIALACVGMRNQLLVLEPTSSEFLLELTFFILNKKELEWFERSHEAELAQLLTQFSVDESYPQDSLLVFASTASAEAVLQDIVTKEYIPQPIRQYLSFVNSMKKSPYMQSIVDDIAGIFEMADEELIRFFRWNLEQMQH
jgi:hypothetical protein